MKQTKPSMMKNNIASLFTCAMLSFAPCVSAAPEDSGRLTGTPIGSPSVDYVSGTVSETVNTPSCAFDDNFNTIYASYDAQYAWVGLDLGSPHVIDSICSPSYVHDPDHWFYLYTDEGSSGITVRNNWTPSEKYLQNANGPGNVWENNGPQAPRHSF